MEKQSMQELAHALFEYIKEVSQLNLQRVLAVEKQMGYVFLNKLNDPSCITFSNRDSLEGEMEDSDGLLIRFHKPDYTVCPAPNKLLEPWLEPGWHDYRRAPVHLDILPSHPVSDTENEASSEIEVDAEQPSILPDGQLSLFSEDESLLSLTQKAEPEHFEDDPERVCLFDEWMAERGKWVDEQQHITQLRNAFADLFDMYNLYRQSPDTLQLMVGNGILTDKRNREICHPLYLKSIQIKLDSVNNTLLVSDTDEPGEMYLPMFSALEDVNSDLIRPLEKDAQDKNIHPLDHNECGDLLKSVTHTLSSGSKYFTGEEPVEKSDERIIVRWNPVIFLRKRPDGTLKALESIIQDLENGAEIPGSLIGILGGGYEVNRTGESGIPDSSAIDWAEPREQSLEDEDILLPKPANREQMQIVRQIEHAPAVLVQGPPGTGKTHTIANLLGHFLAQGKTVLVTSHTSKALTVLKEKVPKEIQPLCVALLGDNQADMEESIRAIIEYTTLNNSYTQRAKATKQREERHQILLKLQDARKLVYAIRHKEFEPIVYGGESWSPSKAAAYVAERESLMALLPGAISEGVAFPLTEEELSWLYASNDMISLQEEKELSYDLPDAEDLLSPEQLADGIDLQDRLNKQLQILNNDRNVLLAWKANRYAVIDTQTDQVYAKQGDYQAESELRTILAIYEETIPAWATAAIADGSEPGLARKKWERLFELITETYTKSQKVLENGLNRPIKIKTADYETLILPLQELQFDANKHGHVKKGLFMKKEKKDALEAVSIGGTAVETADDIKQVLEYIELLSLREQLAQLWNSLLVPHGVKRFSDLGAEPERFCYQQRKNIDFWLNWIKKGKNNLVEEAEMAGVGPSLLQPFHSVLSVTDEKAASLIQHIQEQLIPAVNLLHLVNQLYVYTHSKENTFELLMGCPKSEVCRQLQNAIDLNAVEDYQIRISWLIDIQRKADIAERRNKLLEKIDECAPDWAAAVRNRVDSHGDSTVPEGLQTAWKVHQLSAIVEKITSTPLSEAQKGVSLLTDRYRKETAKLAATLAWCALQERIDANPSIRQSLNGWKQTIAKIGKGTGKRAPALKAEARKLMLECQKAVPAWIMPVSTVMNSVDPSATKYDVIIIDEASQSDITAAAILYMGKKIIVVGDDEQVSPLAVGIDETKMENLMNMLIKDKIPNAHLWDAKTSLYDIAAQVYQPLMLREHFRCVPDIIGYSNQLSYQGKIKPLREAGSSPFKTATVSYRVNGTRRGRSKTNEEEAKAIVALIQACMEHSEYADKSFGVISMLGDDQVKLINRELANAIPLPEYEQHQILCGNASNFQGDERDVIFLSLVDSNDADGPLPMASGEGGGTAGKSMKQRYNVAVSRAKDQLWVIHSLDSGIDLKPGDMRRRLLEYVANPKSYDQVIKSIEAEADSPFETEVATALVTRGYHIKQQVQVGAYFIDMVAICGKKQIAIECDGERWHSGEEKIREDMERQSILERIGWKFIRIRGSEYYRGKSQAIDRVICELNADGIFPESTSTDAIQNAVEDALLEQVKTKAAQILQNADKVEIPPPPNSKSVSHHKKPGSVPMEESDNPVHRFHLPPKPNLGSEPPNAINHVQATMPLPDDDVLAALQLAHFTCIDNRKESGILWVIYEAEKKEVFDSLSKRYSFTYALERRGAVSTKNQPAWRVRTAK